MSLMGQIQKVNLPADTAQVIPSDFGGIVSKAARQTWLNFNSTSSNAAMAEADTRQADAYKEATGQDIRELYPTPSDYQQAIGGQKGYLTSATGRREFVNNKLDTLRAENPELYSGIPTAADQVAIAGDIANKSTRDLEEAQYFTRSSAPGVATFVGGLGGAVADPVNLATMPFGGGGKTVLQLMMREALIGGATELALQPAIMDWQNKIGQEYGLNEAATNVVFGMVGAAGLSGVFRGASVAYDKLANHYIDNEVMNAGFKQLSIDSHLKENDPSTTVYGSKTHLEAVDFGERAMANGFIPEARTVARGNELEFMARQDADHLDLVERARAEGIDFDDSEALKDFIVSHLQKTEPIFTPVDKPEKIKYTGQIQEDRDELLVAIAKAGGISRADAEAQGIDPSHFGLQSAGIKRAFTKKGKSLDSMAEELSQYGYFKGDYSANELLQLITDSLGGNKHYTPEGFTRAAEAAEADDLMRFGDAESDYLDEMLTKVVDDFAFSAREINADINSRPVPTDLELSNFQQVLTDNEIFPELRSKDSIARQLDELESPEVESATMADFERNVEANGDDIIYMDDGSTISIRNLQEQFKRDEQVLDAINSCSIGGGE